jgi:hypothetical protein
MLHHSRTEVVSADKTHQSSFADASKDSLVFIIASSLPTSFTIDVTAIISS